MSQEISRSTVEEVVAESSGNGSTNVQRKYPGEGIYITWEDLWVTVSSRKKGTISILQSATGYAKPGELLAIMGPSGSGKSTLLDALAGRLGLNTRQTGNILINGRQRALAYGTSAYVTQDDILINSLTVREAVYYSAQLQLPDTMTIAEKRERAELTITEMGLQEAMNTRIGGWTSKALSGGQKRRVSICIEILARPKLLFLDEPTSGLDSAASYYVMSRIAKLDLRDGVGRTIIASIHQPSSEVFQLFHNLCLLSSGKTVYFGPTSDANEFFAMNGFPCPTLQNPSDHFLKTINKDFQLDIEEGDGVLPTEEAIKILTEAYKSSGIYEEVLTQVAQICKQDNEVLEKKRKNARFLTQCQVLIRRSFVNMHRDLGYYWFRMVIYILLSIALSTVFINLGHGYRSIQARGSLIMFVASFLTYMSIGGFPSFVEDMKVFERERLNGHYSVAAFVVGNTIASIPYLVMVALIPGAIVYFPPGLQNGGSHFSYFFLVLFACMLLVEGLMMIVASLIPNYLMGIMAGSGIQGLMILGGGFFRLPKDLPAPFYKYPLYYVAFHRYAFQGLFKNEFHGLKFEGNRNGEEILRNTWQVETAYSKWVDLLILLCMVFFYRFMFLANIKIAEKIKPWFRAYMFVPRKKVTQITASTTPTATPLQEGRV